VPTVTAGGLVGADAGSFAQTYDTKNAGSGKTLTATGTISDGNAGNNYVITFAPNTSGVITARPITVSAVTDAKSYDGTIASSGAPAISSGSLAGTDTASFTQRFDTKNAGTGKTMTAAGSISDGNGGNNYTITFAANTTGVIGAVPLSVTADDKTRAENTPNPPFTATYSGFKPGDSPSDLGGALVFGTPATAASPAGLYPITPSGVTSTNYVVAFVDGALTVTAGAATPPTNGVTITAATGAIASTVTPPAPRTPAAAPSSGEVLNTLAPTAGGPGSDESSIEQISPRISVVNCGIQSPAQGCGPR
jgi:hypothetical protein